jgi:hypothetical protein
MKRFIIEEGERERIMNMHKTAIKKQYLSEQGQVVDKTIIDKIIEKWITFDLGPEGVKVAPDWCKPGIKNSLNCLNYVKGEEPELLDSWFEIHGFKKYTDQWSDEDFVNAINIYNNLEKNKTWKYNLL